jgi:hypothetical protein
MPERADEIWSELNASDLIAAPPVEKRTAARMASRRALARVLALAPGGLRGRLGLVALQLGRPAEPVIA